MTGVVNLALLNIVHIANQIGEKMKKVFNGWTSKMLFKISSGWGRYSELHVNNVYETKLDCVRWFDTEDVIKVKITIETNQKDTK